MKALLKYNISDTRQETLRPHPIQLVVLDSNVLYTEGVTKILSDTEVDVIAERCESFIEKVEANRSLAPDIILIRTDQLRQTISTVSLIRQLNEATKILVQMDARDDLLFTKLLRLGVNGIIMHSSSTEELKLALFSLYQHGQYYNFDLSKIWKYTQQLTSVERLADITKREVEVLQLIYQEFTNEEIAELLFISKRTVEGHRQNLLEKTGAKNTVGLVKFALTHNLIKES